MQVANYRITQFKQNSYICSGHDYQFWCCGKSSINKITFVTKAFNDLLLREYKKSFLIQSKLWPLLKYCEIDKFLLTKLLLCKNFIIGKISLNSVIKYTKTEKVKTIEIGFQLKAEKFSCWIFLPKKKKMLKFN